VTPIEWAKLLLEVGGPVFGAYFGSLRFALQIGRQLGRQDAELKWQSLTMKRMAEKDGSVPPPREKLMTLDDPMQEDWDHIVRDAKGR